MKFILFYIFRRFFVRLSFSDSEITLSRGVFFTRKTVLRRGAITKITSRRTPLMRLFRLREVSVYTSRASLTFCLGREEATPLDENFPRYMLRARPSQIIFGAFISTRALAGILFFIAVLSRARRVFTRKYLSRLIAAFSLTAERFSRTLAAARIIIPRFTAFIAMFALFSWIFAFTARVFSLLDFKFASSKSRRLFFISHGFFTVYETTLVQNSAPITVRETFTCALTRCAPVYFRGELLLPCVKLGALSRRLDRISESAPRTAPRAVFAQILAPLCAVLVTLPAMIFLKIYLPENELISGTAAAIFSVNIYKTVLGTALAFRARSRFGKRFSVFSSRRSNSVLTAILPRELIFQTVSRRPFFSSSARSLTAATLSKKRFTAYF